MAVGHCPHQRATNENKPNAFCWVCPVMPHMVRASADRHMNRRMQGPASTCCRAAWEVPVQTFLPEPVPQVAPLRAPGADAMDNDDTDDANESASAPEDDDIVITEPTGSHENPTRGTATLATWAASMDRHVVLVTGDGYCQYRAAAKAREVTVEVHVADLVRVTQQWAKLAPTRERAEALDHQLHRYKSVLSAVRRGVPVLAAEHWGNASDCATIASACGRAVIIARVEVATGAVSLVSRTTLQGTNARERRHAATPDADDVVLAYVNNNHYNVLMPSLHAPPGEMLRRHRNRRRARARETHEMTAKHRDQDDGRDDEI